MPTFDLGKVVGPQGPQGDKGEQGEQGVQGIQGVAGNDGVTPDIQVGAVTTLPAGSPATVTRQASSPDAAPVFDFGIPKGADAVNPGDMMTPGGSRPTSSSTQTGRCPRRAEPSRVWSRWSPPPPGRSREREISSSETERPPPPWGATGTFISG